MPQARDQNSNYGLPQAPTSSGPGSVGKQTLSRGLSQPSTNTSSAPGKQNLPSLAPNGAAPAPAGQEMAPPASEPAAPAPVQLAAAQQPAAAPAQSGAAAQGVSFDLTTST